VALHWRPDGIPLAPGIQRPPANRTLGIPLIDLRASTSCGIGIHMACGTDHKIHTGASGLETSGSRYSLLHPWAAVAPHSPFPISATSPSEPPCSRTWFRTTHYN
jgi:hypothetical protein